MENLYMDLLYGTLEWMGNEGLGFGDENGLENT